MRPSVFSQGATCPEANPKNQRFRISENISLLEMMFYSDDSGFENFPTGLLGSPIKIMLYHKKFYAEHPSTKMK